MRQHIYLYMTNIYILMPNKSQKNIYIHACISGMYNSRILSTFLYKTLAVLRPQKTLLTRKRGTAPSVSSNIFHKNGTNALIKILQGTMDINISHTMQRSNSLHATTLRLQLRLRTSPPMERISTHVSNMCEVKHGSMDLSFTIDLKSYYLHDMKDHYHTKHIQ